MLVELGSVHQLDRLARERLGGEVVLVIERDRGADAERVHGRGGNRGGLHGPRRGLEDRLRLARLSCPPEPRARAPSAA